MQRRRASPEAQAEERTQKAIKRGGDSRTSTVYVDPAQGGKARHGHVDRLSYNYGHAEGGKPRRGDLRGLRVRRRREGDSFEPDIPSSDHDRTVRLATERTKPIGGLDIFEGDSEAKAWYVYFTARRTPISPTAAMALASKMRRLGMDASRLASTLRQHSDLSPCPRPLAQKASQLADGQFATALLILRAQGLVHEHRNTWPYEYTFDPPSDGVNDT